MTPVPPKDVQRAAARAVRWIEDGKDATGFRRGDDGYPSPGRVAWDAWGGDAGQRWAARQTKQTDAG